MSEQYENDALSVSQYERPVQDLLHETEVTSRQPTTPEDLARKMAAVRDTGVVSRVLQVSSIKVTGSGRAVAHLVAHAGHNTVTELSLDDMGLHDVAEAFLRERPYWTTEELMAHRLFGTAARPSETFYVRLSVDDNAVWTLDYLYTETQYERLFKEQADGKWRFYAHSVRRLGRVDVEPFRDVELFTSPQYDKFDERDMNSRLDS